jgi:NitT/TauT family transport system permease protein
MVKGNSAIVRSFRPFEKLTDSQSSLWYVFWLILLVGGWINASVYSDVKIIPSPLMVLSATKNLFSEGLVRQFGASLGLCGLSTLYALLVSLIIAYLSPLPIMRPLAQSISKLRYVPMIGITYYLTQLQLTGRPLQITILSLFMTVYFITSIMSMIGDIPVEEYDLARTMGCSRWEMLWIVVIKGRMDYVLEILKQNLAITWMMFVSVEVLVTSTGGVGILMKNSEKTGNQERIFAIQILIFLLGVLIDYLLTTVRVSLFRYSKTVKAL